MKALAPRVMKNANSKSRKELAMSITPKILQVDANGHPKHWISFEEAVIYYAKKMVLFELGTPVVTYRGGYDKNSAQSRITANSIIGIKNCFVDYKEFNRVPVLTNKKLFERDRHLCAYCGDEFVERNLSRDHVKPVCAKGADSWTNVVTSCKKCNSRKGGRTPEEAGMSLLYLPYEPNRYENFILAQGPRRILADQMDFLISKVSKHSRMRSS